MHTPLKLVVLDRDGTINQDRDDYVKSPEEWVPIDGALEAIARLNHAGWHTVVATNQSGLGRGLFDMSALNAMHLKMNQMLARHGGRIAVIGVLTEPVATLPWFVLFMKNLSLRTGLVNPQNYIPRLLPLIETGRLDPTVIISHRLPLSDGPRGYDVFAHHKENVLKVVLQP